MIFCTTILAFSSSKTPLALAAYNGGAYISDESYVDTSDDVKPIINNPTLNRYTMQTLPNLVTRYEQENSYYCVPATMQTILRYNNQTTPPSQNTIANEMNCVENQGVDFLNVTTYLNAHQTKTNYVLHLKDTKNEMTLRINADITQYKVPTSIRIVVTDINDWYYTTSGHALVCYGISTDREYIRLIDPLPNHTSYVKSSDELFEVFTHLAW